MRMVPIGSCVSMLGLKLVQLLGKDLEVCYCWKRYIRGLEFEVSKAQIISN